MKMLTPNAAWLFTFTLGLSELVFVGNSAAQFPYPAKSIQMLVPVQAGSAADSILRIVTSKMAENMKQQIVLENLPGAAGLIALERAARAPTDGYAIMGTNDGSLVMTPHLYKKVNYDSLNSFDPVSLLAAINFALIVTPTLPVKTVKEFLALAKSRPGEIDYSSGGNGSPQHIAMEALTARADIKLNHVPYRGATQAALDVIGGQVVCHFGATSIVLGQIRERKVRAIGVGSGKRSSLLPEVPTISESGVPGFEFYTWAGIFVPKGTSKTVVDKLNVEVVKAVNDPGVRAKLQDISLDPVGSSAEELGRLTREGYARMGELIRKIGLKPQ
jgi:tripartite-type tricarboxylate transporter receptor subunit TctC